MNVDALVAIDVHTHAEVSERDPQGPTVFQEAAQKYFKHDHPRPTIPEIAAYYRERKIACVIFSVDGERARGIKPVSNEEVAEARRAERGHHDSVCEHRSGPRRRGCSRSAAVDRKFWRQGLQVPSAVSGVLPERPLGLSRYTR